MAALDLRKEPSNIIDFDLIAQLSRAIDEASKAKLLLLTTSLPHFSVGVDVKIHTPELAPRMLMDFHKVIRKLYHFPGVTACLIKGFALGGGLELALVCDFICADHEARLGFPEIRLACFPPVAAVLLPKWIGKQSNILLLGDTISAQRASEIGIVDEVIPPEHSAKWVQHFKDQIHSYSRDALLALKKALRQNAGFDFDKALQDCEKIYVKELLASPDAAEGVLAFLEKRSPVYGASPKPKLRRSS